MTRLHRFTEAELTPEQRELWDDVTGGERAAAHGGSGGLVASDGALIGPFNAWLHSPELGVLASKLGSAVRFHSKMETHLRELAIVVVAVHWRSNFEYAAHRAYALSAGIDEGLVDSLVLGEELPAHPADQRLIIEGCQELLREGRLSDDHFEGLTKLLGPNGVVDLVTLVGYYTLVSFTLNAFMVSPLDGDPQWPE